MGKRMLYAVATMTGTAVGIGASAAGLLRHQASSLRRGFDGDGDRPFPTIAEEVPAPPDHDDGGTASLAVIGDSWVCGIDVDDPADTPAMLIGRGLARLLGTAVRVQSTARPSALSDTLSEQVDEILSSGRLARHGSDPSSDRRRFAIISIGTGDVIHPIHGPIGIPALNQAINRLQREGRYTVFVLVCPNLGGLPGLRDPLKTTLRRSSRVLAGSQWLAALSARAVPLQATGSLTGTTRKSLLNESGRFPSALGYAQLASTVLAAIAERLEAPIAVDRSHDIPDDTRETPEDSAAASDAGTVASEGVMSEDTASEGVASETTATETAVSESAADDPVEPQTEGRAG